MQGYHGVYMFEEKITVFSHASFMNFIFQTFSNISLRVHL